MPQNILVTVDLGKLFAWWVCMERKHPCCHAWRADTTGSLPRHGGHGQWAPAVGTARWVGVGDSGTMAQAGRDRMVCPAAALGPRRTLPTRSLNVDKRGDYPNLEDFQCLPSGTKFAA